MPCSILKNVVVIALVVMSTLAQADARHVIDQRDPNYQQAIDHLSNASAALALAQSELKKAEGKHPLPGLDLAGMSSSLSPVEETLRVLLVPERKRLKHQTAIPDGAFFYPTPIGE